MLTLASASPQRRAILEQLGIAFEVRPADVEEATEGEPAAVAEGNAVRKAEAVAGDLVLGCDTIVVLDDRILGKPRDAEEARAFLGALAGREHRVLSGLAVLRDGALRSGVAETTVAFRRVDGAFVDAYVATEEWRGRAGGYAIQGRGASLVEGIAGDYANVVGLPVALLLDLVPDLLDPST